MFELLEFGVNARLQFLRGVSFFYFSAHIEEPGPFSMFGTSRNVRSQLRAEHQAFEKAAGAGGEDLGQDV